MIEDLIQLCRDKKLTLGVAESCTGGGIGKALTDVPGSSDVFWGGYIVYHNDAKVSLLRVRPESLEAHGAVSKQVVKEMLSGVLSTTTVDIALAVSGVAGPGGGTPDKPVGTIWIGGQQRGQEPQVQCWHYKGDRPSIREQVVKQALELALEFVRP